MRFGEKMMDSKPKEDCAVEVLCTTPVAVAPPVPAYREGE